MKFKFRKLILEEAGVSAVFTVLILSFLLTIASLTIDIGLAYIDASETQNISDAIALSIGKYLPLELYDESSKATIISTAIEYAGKNGYDELTCDDVIFKNIDSGRYMSVEIVVTKTFNTYLAKIVGVNEITTSKSSTVSAVPTGAITGGVPIGITADAYTNAVASGITEHVIFKDGGGDGENGFFGFIVLDGKNSNASSLLETMMYGSPNEIRVGDLLAVATGNMTSVASEGVDYRLSLCTHYEGYGGCTYEHYVEGCPRIMYFMIYDFVDSNTVRITGFSSFILEPSENADEIQGSFISSSVPYTKYTSDMDCGVYTYRLTG